MREQPVAGRDILQPLAGRRVDSVLGDVDVDSLPEIDGKPGDGLERRVGKSEACVGADETVAARPQEALVLRQTGPHPIQAVAVRHLVTTRGADANLGAGIGDDAERALDRIRGGMVVDDRRRPPLERLERAQHR